MGFNSGFKGLRNSAFCHTEYEYLSPAYDFKNKYPFFTKRHLSFGFFNGYGPCSL